MFLIIKIIEATLGFKPTTYPSLYDVTVVDTYLKFSFLLFLNLILLQKKISKHMHKFFFFIKINLIV